MPSSKFELSHANRSGGSSVLEFLVALPLIIIFFVGIFELGRILGQTNWVSQTTYNAALIGAGAPGTAETRRENTEKLARELFNASTNTEFVSAHSTPAFVADFNNADRSVKVSFQGALREILPSFISRNLSISSTLPLLGADVVVPPSEYENPDPLLCDPTHEKLPPTELDPTGCGTLPTVPPDCTTAPRGCSPPTAVPNWTPPQGPTLSPPGGAE